MSPVGPGLLYRLGRGSSSGGRQETGVGPETGAAAVDFVLVMIPLLFVVLAILQIALVVFVRTTVVDALSEGARVGAAADRSPQEGAAYAQNLIGSALSPAYADTVSGSREGADVVVRADIAVPVLGLFELDAVTMALSGHAVAEIP